MLAETCQTTLELKHACIWYIRDTGLLLSFRSCLTGDQAV